MAQPAGSCSIATFPPPPPPPTFLEQSRHGSLYDEIVAGLPRNTSSGVPKRRYRGVWVRETHIPHIVAATEAFRIRPSDILLASFPKCGTTWLKALAYAIANRELHPPLSPEHPLLSMNPHELVLTLEVPSGAKTLRDLESLPSPRLIHTHLPYKLLPQAALVGGCRVVYVCREPKDALVSLGKFVEHLETPFLDTSITTDQLLEMICKGEQYYGTPWDHVAEFWEMSSREPERVLFLRYEEMIRDPSEAAKTLAEFVGLPFSDEEVEGGVVEDVVRLCSFEKLSKLEVNKKGFIGNKDMYWADKASFFRNGKVGDWKNHMTPEMVSRLDCIVGDRLCGTGLAFD